MSFQINVPPSLVSKMAKSAEGDEEEGGVSGEKKREDWRKLKELEEARKAGTAPAMQDEEGKDINPHIPQYIMQAPWYYSAMTPTLRHQRVPGETIKTYSDMDSWYHKGVMEGKIATKFRKGACENCGAMTHKKKDCLERPRKLGAKFTGEQIAPDEHLQPNLDFDFEGKRDRWNGYDPNMHRKIIEDYQQLEEAKRELKAQNMDRDIATETEKTEDEEKTGPDDDEDKYVDEMDMPGQKFETKQRITVRNLRIREDTAKYLYNLDVNSAHYDPKTRSMRQNPFDGKDTTEIPYAGDNFVRHSGDAHDMAKQQLFAWEAYEKGAEVHLQADPTKLEALASEFHRKKNEFKTNVKKNILDKYGGLEHLDAPPKQLLLAQTEDYVEYSRHGTVVKGQEKAKMKSHYEEDVHPNNHTSVWGSFWKDGQWGYKCCHSYIKESYCTGHAGVVTEQTSLVPLVEETADSSKVIASNVEGSEVNEEGSDREEQEVDASKLTSVSSRTSSNPMDNLDPEEVQSIMEQYHERLAEAKKRMKKREKKKKKRRKMKKSKRESSSSSEESEDENEEKECKIREAMAKEEERVKQIDHLMTMDERKRPYNVMYDLKPPTEEELEAYRRKQGRFDDPMAYLAGK